MGTKNTLKTRITSNGSKWAGQSPDSIEVLLEVLTREPLDPTFEEYGNFISENPCRAVPGKLYGEWVDGPLLFPGRQVTRFFGNFHKLSHVFNIDTDEPDVIEPLTVAIRANQQTTACQQAKRDIASRKAREQADRQRRVDKDTEEIERRQLARLQVKYEPQPEGRA